MSGIKNWLRRVKFSLKHDFFAIENVVLVLAVFLCLMWTFQSIQAMSRNWELTERLTTEKRELELLKVEIETAELENEYYKTEEYQELSARKYLDKKLPDENMVVMPNNTEEAKNKHKETKVATSTKEYSNFEKWMKFLFPGYNLSMRTMKKGFTLIEVMLFLVLTGALFVAVAVGTQNSIFQQRYNDSIQNFVEFLRGIYSQVSNVENLGGGRSEKAIYGKLITFGEARDLAEKQITGKTAIFTYNVIGDVGDVGTGDVLTALDSLNANVLTINVEESDFFTTGMASSYVPRWGSKIESTSAHTDFKGSILIVRHPRSGTIFTYYSPQVIPVNQTKYTKNQSIRTAADDVEKKNAQEAAANPLKSKLSTFVIDDIYFCLNPYGEDEARSSSNIRLVKKARNASGIVLPAVDGEDNRCAS